MPAKCPNASATLGNCGVQYTTERNARASGDTTTFLWIFDEPDKKAVPYNINTGNTRVRERSSGATDPEDMRTLTRRLTNNQKLATLLLIQSTGDAMFTLAVEHHRKRTTQASVKSYTFCNRHCISMAFCTSTFRSEAPPCHASRPRSSRDTFDPCVIKQKHAILATECDCNGRSTQNSPASCSSCNASATKLFATCSFTKEFLCSIMKHWKFGRFALCDAYVSLVLPPESSVCQIGLVRLAHQ